MFKVDIDWTKAHKDTKTLLVSGTCVTELSKDEVWLRHHSLVGVLGDTEIKREPEVPVNAGAQNFMAPPPCAPGAPEPVKLDKCQFDQLLAKLKQQATTKSLREDQKLTIMEIHEKLIEMKV